MRVGGLRAGPSRWRVRGGASGPSPLSTVDLRSSDALASSVQTLGDAPLVVITAGRDDDDTTDLPRRLLQLHGGLWGRMQAELARLSSDHAHVVALDSDHFVQRLEGQPLVVIRAVQAVVRAERDNAQLPPCERPERTRRPRLPTRSLARGKACHSGPLVLEVIEVAGGAERSAAGLS